eukprot:TRINITY_DN3853_c3_g1_i1.p1 TRINITY_DN3853_c3_g1~~TRINITY_DN3853_c3_g1_i1.p1  ORF type:complete len:847 (+),score=183.08 TRINITY_DN3853_c3_g1_i1:52-2541(+)
MYGTPRDYGRHTYIEERDKQGVVVKRYLHGKLLGKGGFAKCYLVTDSDTQEDMAVKVIDKSSLTKPKMKNKLVSEIKIHSMMNHPNLVQYKHCFEDDRNVYIMLELCTEQTLMEHSKRKRRFTELETSYLIDQCLKGISYMHGHAVIHRDLKLSNLLLNSKMEVKIADFGLATQLDYDGERKRTICGTPNYIAPEILEGGHKGHSYEVDIWSLGVILYTLLVGKPPFEMSDRNSTYRRIRQVSYSFPPDLHISSEAKNLVRRILQADPEKRPTLESVENDPFFRLYPPPSMAPLSLFQPGTSSYVAHERRLLDAGLLDRYSGARRVPSQGRSPLTRIDGNAGLYRGSSVPRGGSMSRMSSQPVKTPQQYPAGGHKDPLAGLRSVGGYENWSPSYRSNSASSPRKSAGTYRMDRGEDKYAALSPPALQGGGNLPPPSLSTSPQSPYAATRSSTTATHSAVPGVFSPQPRGYGVAGHTPPPQTQRFSPKYGSSPDSSPDFAAAVLSRSPSAGLAGARSPSAGGISRSPSQPYQYSAATTTHNIPPPQIPTPTPQRGRAGSIPHHTPPQATPLVETADLKAHRAGEVEQDDDKDITLMQNNLERTMNGLKEDLVPAPQASPTHEADEDQCSITCYSDFTDKYGMCYLMNNGNIGVHFNDSTKMVWDATANVVQYVSRGKMDANGVPAGEDRLFCTIEDYPETLKKKITLISYFKNYLTRTRNPKDYRQYEVVQCGKGKLPIPSVETDLVYVKRWSKTRYASIFRLSNKSVQVSFFDGTEILLFSEARQVTYTDELGCASTFALTSMLTHPKPEIAQRLKYTKEIINRLINKA